MGGGALSRGTASRGGSPLETAWAYWLARTGNCATAKAMLARHRPSLAELHAAAVRHYTALVSIREGERHTKTPL